MRYKFLNFIIFLVFSLFSQASLAADPQYGSYDREFFNGIANHEKTRQVAQCLAIGMAIGDLRTPMVGGSVSFTASLLRLEMSIDGDEEELGGGNEIGYVNYETGFIAALSYYQGEYAALTRMSSGNSADEVMRMIEDELDCSSNTIVNSIRDYQSAS